MPLGEESSASLVVPVYLDSGSKTQTTTARVKASVISRPKIHATCKRFSGQTEMLRTLLKLLRNEDGATAIEYGLIAALIAVAAVAAMTTVGTNLSATFNSVASQL
jgi:pilus assembly protein Flp/PilA